MPSAADLANEQMVDRMISEGSLWSPALIAAFRATPRHAFLDRVFVLQRRRTRWREVLCRAPTNDQLDMLYSDQALITGLSPEQPGMVQVPISSSSQPSLMAQMLQDLHLEPGMRVLEVGTGTGYNAALLAHVVGPERVTSIDVDKDVLSRAWDHLRAFADRKIHLRHADGRDGFPEHAPYDRIVVTAAALDLEMAWLNQVEGGSILAPLILAPGLEFLVCGTARHGTFEGRLTRAAYFMPLRSEGETGRGLLDESPGSSSVKTSPAPWAGWFNRRRLRTSWLGFSQSLAFLSFLRGLNVHTRALESGTIFAASDPDRACWCWFGQEEWQSSDEAGKRLGDELWHSFLELGGPWPTEFRLQASPAGGLSAGQGYLHQGPRCLHRWERIEARDRPGWI